ncbi:Uncharacterised protein [Yersinia frederiksenii]|nr:Uncharacterised protein [Yersinia frederiksenii]
MSHYSFNDVQDIFAKIDNDLKSQRIIRPKRVNDNRKVTALEVQARYAQGYQAWMTMLLPPLISLGSHYIARQSQGST